MLHHGDNLTILRERIADASVDLVYLDPPFNSGQAYYATGQRAAGPMRPTARFWRRGWRSARACCARPAACICTATCT